MPFGNSSDFAPAGMAARPPAPRRLRTLKRGLLMATAIVAVAGPIYGGIRGRITAEAGLARTTSEAAVPSVLVIHPLASAPQSEIALPGYTQAFTDTPVYARTSGYLKAWYYDIGAHVKKGDLLAEIDTPEVDQELRQARADLVTAEANRTLASITAKRDADLFKNNRLVSTQQRDNSAAALAAEEAIVQSKEANVARLEQLQSYEKVVAPFDGVITARNTDTGALIAADANSLSKELFHLAAIDKLRVYVSVPEVYDRAARIGGTATLTLDEFPGQSFEGTLVRTANAIDLASRTLLAEVDVDNSGGLLLPGAYTFVHLSLPASATSVTIPANTLLFRREGLRVAVVRAGLAQLVAVKIGRDYGERVEILSGLHPTDEVIAEPADSLVSGTAVHVEDATEG
jgi:RND family efflux transporter MFP subunit